ncbi:MAG: hypothetical protein BM485_08555 [Desulfobulbaceae bacterium DB1]|nr:MAG: hypothetical protein BM485_08555 [Desulfobulbaceae bacterium DB1]
MKLASRFYVVTLVPIAVIISGIVFYNLNIFTDRLKDVTEQTVAANIREIKLLTDNPIFRSYFDNIQYDLKPEAEINRQEVVKLFSRVMHGGKELEPTLIHIALLDAHGNTIVSREMRPPDNPFLSPISIPSFPTAERINSEVKENRHLTLAVIGDDNNSDSLLEKGEICGYLFVEHSLPIEGIRAKEHSFLSRQLKFIAICSCLLAGLIYWAGRSVTAPIRTLVRQAKDIAEEGFNKAFTAGNNISELSDLGNTLNSMLGVIEEKQQQFQAANTRLRQEIGEREKAEEELENYQNHLEELVGRSRYAADESRASLFIHH